MSPSVAIACRLAAEHPEGTLPCPLCAGAVGAPKLAGHLAKVHGASPSDAGSAAVAPLTLVGLDGRTQALCAVSAALYLLLLVAALPVVGVPFGPLEATLALLAALPVAALILAQYHDKLRATLVVDGARVTLGGVLGTRLGARELTLPATLESGRRIEKRPAPPGLPYAENAAFDHDAGAYLRLRSGGVSITLVAEKAPGLARYWREDGFTHGPDARRHDLRVGATELTQLTYHLAALGLLEPERAPG